MDHLSVLQECGLSTKEVRTYLALLALGSSTIKPIADHARLKRTSIYNFMPRLIEMGIVGKTTKRGRTYFHAQSPTRLVERQRQRLSELEQWLPALASLMNVKAGRPRISVFEGAAEIRNIVREEVYCTKEALYVWPGKDIIEMIGGVRFMTGIDRERIARGVQIRTVRFREKDVRFPTSAHGPKFLRQLRFAPPQFNTTMGLGIYDSGKVGFFSSHKEAFGILIESQEIYGLIKGLFELLWLRSTSAREGEG